MASVQPPVKRRYDASRRREAAARNRAAILDAALRLFTSRGYTATPMTAIAEQAGVSFVGQLRQPSSRSAFGRRSFSAQ
jgi:hypothetical protein